MRETHQVTVEILKDVDDDDDDDDDNDNDDGVHLTTASYTMEDEEKDYVGMGCIIPAHNMVQWWAF